MTLDQYNRLLARVTKLEETMNDILTAQKAFVTRAQTNQLLILQQTEQQALTEQLTALELRVTNIEEEY
jgi:hypothetical protein